MILLIYVQKGKFGKFSSCWTFTPSFSPPFLVTIKNIWKKVKRDFKMAFLFHDPLTFVARKPLLPLSLKNPLDHVNNK
jgi:hypothetical protein